MRSARRAPTLLVAFLLATTASACGGAEDPGPAPASAPVPVGPEGSWSLRFADEFSGTSVDWEKWADTSSAEADAGRGNKDNQQLEWNQGENCSVADGRLTITAKPDDITSDAGIQYDWSSCLITSSPSFAFRYGYLETRARLTPEPGFWSAFWTWQAEGLDRRIETDVYEHYSHRPRLLDHTQHSGEGGSCLGSELGFDPSQEFHTYGADIAPDGTDFYVDGAMVCSVAGTSTGMTNIVVDMFVYAEVPPDPGTVATKQVDYVRVWQR